MLFAVAIYLRFFLVLVVLEVEWGFPQDTFPHSNKEIEDNFFFLLGMPKNGSSFMLLYSCSLVLT